MQIPEDFYNISSDMNIKIHIMFLINAIIITFYIIKFTNFFKDEDDE